MAISVGSSSISKLTYQNVQNIQSVKLTLCERVSKIFSHLYEKISNLFSRKPKQMKAKGIEPIYDVPKNNRQVKTLGLYEIASNFFFRGPNRLKLVEDQLELVKERVTQSQKDYQDLRDYIYAKAKQIKNLEDRVNAKETQINSLKEAILSLEDERCSNRTQFSRDSGFLDSTEKKQSFFLKTNQLLKTKIR